MSKKEEKAVQPTGPTDMDRPSFIPKDTRGTENIDVKSDVQMPRLGIAQALSPEIKPGDPKFVEGLKQGDMFNTVTGKIYGRDPLEFTVVLPMGARGVEFAPREQGGGVVDMNVPLTDMRMQFTKDASGKTVKPKATKFYEFILMVLNQPTPELIALSLKSSGLKVAKMLNTLITTRQPPAPSFAGRYSVTPVLAKSKQGDYWTFALKNLGYLRDEGQFKMAENFYETFKDKTIVVDRETPDATPDMDPDAPDAEKEM